MFMRNCPFRLVALVLMLAGAGCGYHLRGMGPGGEFSFSKVLVQTVGSSQTSNELRNRLQQNGVVLVADAGSAEVIVSLGQEKYDRRVLSVDADTGKVLEFELGMELEMEAKKPTGEQLLDAQKITILRDITFDPDQVIGKDEEEQAVRLDMVRDAAQTILFRLETIEL